MTMVMRPGLMTPDMRSKTLNSLVRRRDSRTWSDKQTSLSCTSTRGRGDSIGTEMGGMFY